MKTQIVLAAASLLSAALMQSLPVKASPTNWLKEFAYAGLPQKTNYPNEIQVLENNFYIVGYDNKYMNPAWVACMFKKSFDDKFTNYLRPEQTIWTVDRRTTARVTDSDYDNSNFDRGHMAPNFGMMKCYGPGAQLDTFLMSNIVPQKADMNRGVWKDLEHEISKTWLNKFNDLYVITGPIYDKDAVNLQSGIRVPKACFKIVLDTQKSGKPRTLAFIVPQDAPKGAKIDQYLTSIDVIEEQTGFDFFADLPDSEEAAMEKDIAAAAWK